MKLLFSRSLLKVATSLVFCLALQAKGFAQQSKWIDYRNNAGAFTVKLPAEPEEMTAEIPDGKPTNKAFKPNMYSVADQDKQVSYIFFYNDYPEGMYMANSHLAFNNLAQEFANRGEVIGEPRVIYRDGIEGRAVDVIVEDFYMEVELYLRGNRSYMLLRQNQEASRSKATDDDFFSSFHFLPIQPTAPKPFVLGNVKLQMPGDALLVETESGEDKEESSFLNGGQTHYAVNRNSGGVYGLETATFSKYYKHKNLDTLYSNLLNNLKFKGDSQHKVEEILIGGVKGKEYTAKDTLGGTEKRVRVWIDRDRYFYQIAIVGKEELGSKAFNDYFTQTSYTPVKSTFELSKSKAKLIFDDLLSADTVIRKNAFDALGYYEFDQTELPLVYTALKKNYADDSLKNSTRSKLLLSLPAIKDKTTLPFLKDLFKAKNPDIIKAKVLAAAPIIDSTSYDWYLKNLVETPLKIDDYDYWSLLAPLSDSLAYASKHLDEILPLLGNENYRTVVLHLFSDLLQDDKNKDTYLPLVAARSEKILAKANSDIDGYLAEKNARPSNVYPYLHILANLKPSKLTDEFTNKVFKLDSVPYLHTEAVATRIRTGLKVDQQLLDAQLDSLDTRYQIMNAFNLAGKLKEVPIKYRKHDAFAKLLVYNQVAEDYAPDEINLVGNIIDDAGVYYVFEIVYTEDDEPKSYMAVCGAFDNKSEDLQFNKYSCYWDYDQLEKDWQKQAKSLIELLKKEN